MIAPVISCVCPTHGRAWMIGEAIESYLRQEPCGLTTELFILNDCPEQPLVCDAPGVRIINTPAPIPDVCRKFDLAVKHAAGEWVCWWEDDDISLPWRLRMSVERGVSLGTAYRQTNAWHWNRGEYSLLHAPPIGASIFRRADYLSSGGAQGADGYPDQNMIANLPKCGMVSENAAPTDVFFVYRWAGMGCHDSGMGRGAMLDPAARFAAFHAATLADPRFIPGAQIVTPRWNEDYAANAGKEARRVAG
jgi:hypothetical protein